MRADCAGLTAGNRSVAHVQAIYQVSCMACDGEKGKKGTPATGATVLDSPKSLTPSRVYAVPADTLHLNGIVKADAVLDAAAWG